MSDAHPAMTEAEYLAWEPHQEMTFEFDGVRVHAMNGASIAHERIQSNVKVALVTRLRGSRCEAFGPNTRVPTRQGRYRFPDAVVTCTRLDGAARDLPEPVVIFEVLSDSTFHTDRGAKLIEYRGIESLVRYVMFDQTAALATVVTRVDDHWSIDVVRAGEMLALPEIGIELPLDECYIGLDFEQA